MSGPRWVAVDLGATSGRVISGWLADGRLVTEEVARFANEPVLVPGQGSLGGPVSTLHWDILALWAGVRAGLAAAARSGPVASVGVDSWAVDYGLLDADGALLANPVAYRDERTVGMPQRFFTAMSPEVHYGITGVQVQPFNTVFQVLAAGGSAQLAAARRLLLLPDLISHWLGGRLVAEVTNASTTGLLDARSRAWSAPVLGALDGLLSGPAAGLAWPGGVGVTDTPGAIGLLLPELVEPGTDLGPVGPDLLARARDSADPGVTGFRSTGARVIAVGSHDTASAVAAVPMADPRRAAYVSSGTWSLVGVELDAPVLTESSRAANITNELGVAGTVRYLKNVAGLWLLSQSRRAFARAEVGLGDAAGAEAGASSGAEMRAETRAATGTPADTAAAAAAGSAMGIASDLAGLLAAAAAVPALRTVIDVDDPVFVAPNEGHDDMPARIAAWARASGQPVPSDEAAVTRCILDSLALGYRRAIRAVASEARRSIEVVHIVGGGSNNALLCQLTADATGLPVVAGPVEATAMGNLLVQAWAAGAVADLAALREVVARSTSVRRYAPQGRDRAWDQAERRLDVARHP